MSNRDASTCDELSRVDYRLVRVRHCQDHQTLRGRNKVKASKVMSACLVLILFLFFLTCPSLSAERTKIGIMKFKVAKNLDPSFGGFLYDMLLERMVASGKFTVVDWEEINRLHKYIEQSQPNVSVDEARKQAVNQLGIQKMYVGSLAKIGSKYYVTVKVLNLDLTVEKVQKGSTKSEGGLETCINEVADSLLGLAKESKEPQADGEMRKARLFVETEPGGCAGEDY